MTRARALTRPLLTLLIAVALAAQTLLLTGVAAAAPPPKGDTAPKPEPALTPVGYPLAKAHLSRFLAPASRETFSSAGIGDVTGDGQPDIVTGGLDGILRVWTTAGSLVSTVDMQGGIQATPALGDVDLDGVLDVATATTTNTVGVFSFRGGTARTLLRRTERPSLGPQPNGAPAPMGFFATPALADVDADGRPDVVLTSWDQHVRVYGVVPGRPAGRLLPGWPVWVRDTIWASPAVGDLDGDQKLDIVVAHDCEGLNVAQPCYGKGGGAYVVAYRPDGRVRWSAFSPGQVIWSSPALGDLNGDGAQDVVVGTGLYWKDPAGRHVTAYDGRSGRVLWRATTPGRVMGSPALADVTGDGRMEVFVVSQGAALLALRSDGRLLWRACVDAQYACPPGHPTHSGASVADVDGDGQLEVLNLGEDSLRMYDAATGRLEARSYSSSASPSLVFAPATTPTVASVGGQAWVVSTALRDANGDRRHGAGDELVVMAWRTGKPLGAAPWPGFSGAPDRTGQTGLAPISRAQAEAFVTALYVDLLGRGPDASGLASWSTALVNRRLNRAQVADSLVRTDEWLGHVVRGFYRDTLGREPDATGLRTWVDALRAGRRVDVVAASFYASDEYFRRSGGTNSAWVRDLYRKILGREADSTGLSSWTRALQSGTSRTSVALGFYNSPESLRKRVTTLYVHLLRRSPDPSGLTSWPPLVRSRGDLVLAMYLASSQEYWGKSLSR